MNERWHVFAPVFFPKAFVAFSITKQVSGACGELAMKTGHSKDRGWMDGWMMDAIDTGWCDFPPNEVEHDSTRNNELVAFVITM